MSEKTLGQIGYDAAGEAFGTYPGVGEWEHLPEYGREYWQAAAQAVRAAVIEECAKICDQGVTWTPPLSDKAETVSQEVAYLLGKALRRLIEERSDEPVQQVETPA